MNFLFQKFRPSGFTAFVLLILVVNPLESRSGFLSTPYLPKFQNPKILKVRFFGEIIGYSYIKMTIESTETSNRYKNKFTAFKGTYYESVSSNTFKIIGSYDAESLVWKLDCFDKNNLFYAVFIGKTTRDGNIEGKWTQKKVIRNFYLRKSN